MRLIYKGFAALLLFVIAIQSSIAATKEPVVINALMLSPEYRATISQLVRRFNETNDTIELNYKLYLNEDYHAIRDACLKDQNCPVDIFLGFAGYGFEQRVSQGQIEPIETLWKKQRFDDFYSNIKKSVTIDNKQYGLPLSYYPWGFFYKKSLFKKFNLTPPKTWQEFLQVCKVFKDSNIAPMVIGTKTPFPAASWFSYLNLRLHGLDFHTQLTAGNIPFTDKRVRTTLEYLKDLIEKDYFLKGHQNFTHLKALPYLYRNKGAMYLIGSFILSKMPEQLKPDIGFFRFPQIDTSLPLYEEAPLDVLYIPIQSKHKSAAKKVLSFFAQPDISYQLNRASGYLSPNTKSLEVDDELLLAASRHLKSSAGFSYFFNRNSPPETGRAGTKLLGKFFSNPNDIDYYIQEFEKLRALVKK
jgi:multiple sugar transport system substrate-binding protein